MRLISYQSETGARIAARKENTFVDLNSADKLIPSDIKEFLAGGSAMLEKAEAVITKNNEELETAILDSRTLKFLPVIPDPQKIICIGLNYADHAAETGPLWGKSQWSLTNFLQH